MASVTRFRLALTLLLAGLLAAGCAGSSERRLVSIREGQLAAGYLTGHLVYVETRGVREAAMFSHDLWENERTRIRVPAGLVDAPSWSPDGQRIAFSLTDQAGRSHIWVVNEDGSEPQQVTFGEVVDDHPRWSPDGNFVVFASIRDGDYDWRLFISRVRPATRGAGADDPEMDPDADAASSNEPVSAEVLLSEAFGDLAVGDVVQVGSSDGHSVFPDWSPDGRHIVYSNRAGDHYSLRRFDVPTGADQELLDSGGDDMHARFAPDGASLVYTTNFDDDLWQIWGLDLASDEQWRVIGSDSMDEFPAYSHDGQHLAFSTGHLAIYRADAGPFPDGQLRWAVTVNLAWAPDWKAP